MLFKKSTNYKTIKVLKEIGNETLFSRFFLSGDTALALYLGHRESHDIDFVSFGPFDATRIEKFLTQKYNFKKNANASQNIVTGEIGSIKISFKIHPNYTVASPLYYKGVKLLSIEDLCAMKLFSIARKDSKITDFLDIAHLSTRIPFSMMLEFCEKKYPTLDKSMLITVLNNPMLNTCKQNFVNAEHLTIIRERLKEMTQYPYWIFDRLNMSDTDVDKKNKRCLKLRIKKLGERYVYIKVDTSLIQRMETREKYAKQRNNADWTLYSERAFIENLMSSRFNYYLSTLSILAVVGTNIDDKKTLLIVLGLSTILLTLISILIYRVYTKLIIVLNLIYQLEDYHVFRMIDDEVNRLNNKMSIPVNPIIGVIIPSLGILAFGVWFLIELFQYIM